MAGSFEPDEAGMRRLTEELASQLPELMQEALDAVAASHGGRPESQVLDEIQEQTRRRGVQLNRDSDEVLSWAALISRGGRVHVEGARRVD